MSAWSVVNVSGLPGAFRLDAEFWKPEYVGTDRAIRSVPHKTLGELALSLRKGVFNILAESYVDDGVPFYRSSNVGTIAPRNSDLVYISAQRHAEERKTALKRGDIMLAKTGKEAASVVLVPECNVSQDVIALRPDRRQINPFYLAVFLNTEAGILQMRRWLQGQVQMHLSLPDTRQILIPILSEKDQKKVEALVLESEASDRAARRAITGAQLSLMRALGLEGLAESQQKCYARRFRDLQAERRIDAEFFSPKYQNVIKRLRQDGRTIGDVALLSERAFNPAFPPDQGSTFRYIEIGSLSSDGEPEPEQISAADAPSRAAWVVKSGDVITSTVRPLRRLSALIDEPHENAVCSSGFAVLTPRSEIEPEVLLTYLRLPLVSEILDLHTTATMYPAIPVDRLLRIPIVVPTASVRRTIVGRVQEARALRRRAVQLLSEAKVVVERLLPHRPTK
jgi:hypothetical protein